MILATPRRHALLAALVLLGSGTALAQAQAPAAGTARGPGGIVAVVNQDVITWGDLDRHVTMKMEETARQGSIDPTSLDRERSRFERAVLDWMIEQKLLTQDARKNEITTVDEELDREIRSRIEKEFRPMGLAIDDPEDLYRILKENYGLSRDEYRRQVQDDILIGRLLWTKYFQPDQFVSPGELREYYSAHRSDFEKPSEMTFRMIAVDNGPNAQQACELLDSKLERKVPFEDVAREFYPDRGEDAYLWKKGLEDVKGWVWPLPEVLSRMKEGEVRPRVRIVSGWRYIQMVKVKEGAKRSFEDVQGEIVKSIRSQYYQKEKERLVERLKKEAYIQDFLPPAAAREKKERKDKEEEKKELPPPEGEAPPGKIQDVSPDPVKPRKDAKDSKENKDSKDSKDSKSEPPEKKEKQEK